MNLLNKIAFLAQKYVHVTKIDTKHHIEEIKKYIQELYRSYDATLPFAVVSSGNLISITVKDAHNVNKVLADVLKYIKIKNITRYELYGNVQHVIEIEVLENYINDSTLINLFYKYGSIPKVNINGTITLTTDSPTIESSGSVKIHAADVTNSPNANSILTPFGPVELGRTILSNEYSNFINHAELTVSGVLITLKPYAFDLLCKNAEQNPHQKIAIVVNGKIYYPPIQFIPQDGSPSPRMIVCTDQPAVITKEICNAINHGFYKLTILSTTQDTTRNKHTLILLLCLLCILLALLLISRRRRKATQMLLNIGFIYAIFNQEHFIATAAITGGLYLIGLVVNEKKQTIVAGALSALMFFYPLLSSVLLKAWLILTLESCIAFFVFTAICITLIPFDKKK